LLGGSLVLLAEHYTGSQLQIGGLFGERDFGLASQAVTAALEGALFAGSLVGAMLWAQRRAA
jgi:hypothetical protein